MKRGPLVCVTGDLRGKSCQVVPSRGSSVIPRRRAASHPSAAPGKIRPLRLTAEASQTLIQCKPHLCTVTAQLQMAVVRHRAALQQSPNNIDHDWLPFIFPPPHFLFQVLPFHHLFVPSQINNLLIITFSLFILDFLQEHPNSVFLVVFPRQSQL